MSVSLGRLESLERWSPTLYLVAGGLVVVYTVFNGLEAFTSAAYPDVAGVIGNTGFALGFLGLLGLYPTLTERSRNLARAGAGAAVLGLAAFLLIVLTNIGLLAGVMPEEQPSWFIILVVFGLIGLLVGYLSFGVAVLRSDVFSRPVGLVLLAPAVIVVLMLAHIVAGLSSPESVFVVSAGQAMTHLAIGSTLAAETESAEREEAESAADATARG